MTIVSGLNTGTAVVMCADTQEVISDYAKQTVQKLTVFSQYGNWRWAIAGASDQAHYLELFKHDLASNLSSVEEFDYAKILGIIKATLHKLHKQHIWPRRYDRPSFQTLIAVQGIIPDASKELLVTEDTAVTPVQEYRSVGVGTYLANYLYERLNPAIGFTYSSPAERMAHLAVFLLQQVKHSIHGCDGETVVAIFYADGTFRYLTTDEVHEVESWMAELDASLQPLWWNVASPSMKDDPFNAELERTVQKIESIRAKQYLKSAHRRDVEKYLVGQREAIEQKRLATSQNEGKGTGTLG